MKKGIDEMEQFKKAPATILLAAGSVLAFVILSFGGMTEDSYYMLQNGAMYVPYILFEGEYYRLFTSLFLHFGFTHLTNNMLSLLVLGFHLEPIVGFIKLAIIYFVSGLGGNILSLVLETMGQGYAVSAGASGAIFGFTGALLCLAIRNHGRIGDVTGRGMFLMAAVSLYLGFSSEGVDNAAHIGGFITGMLLALLLCRKRDLKHSSDTDFGSYLD